MQTLKKLGWTLYYLGKIAYFCAGIPFFLFLSLTYSAMLYSDPYFGKYNSHYIVTFGSWFLLLAPGIFMYLRARRRKGKVHEIVRRIKESGFYSPDSDYEVFSLTQGSYFGIDIKKGTMLYVFSYIDNLMMVVGLDIHSFTRTVSDKKGIEIYTRYVNTPSISVPSFCTSRKVSADTMHAMAERGGYHYPVDFPRMIQERRKEWEQIAGIPVKEIF